MLKFLVLLLVALGFVNAKHEIYDGHSLYEVKVDDMDQVDKLMAIIERLNIDIWTYAIPGRNGEFLVSKEMKPIFEDQLTGIALEYKITTENIKEHLDLEEKLLSEASSRSNKRSFPYISFDEIHRYDVVDQYLVDIANRYPSVAQVVSAGRSFEGRDIKYLRISTTNFQDTRKPIVVIQSLLHAREWVTLPVTLYAIEKLVVDVTEQELVNDIDWIILPIANPDGYEFSHTNDRFWRKSRNTNSGFCFGVDLNRNYDFNWGTLSSNLACMETFHGRAPFSEPETQITRNILDEFGDRIDLFMDVHSFGSMILYGYGNRTLPSNALILNLVATQMADSINAVKWPQNRNYIVGNSAMVLYVASGECVDYAQVRIGQGLAYLYELPAYRNQQNTIFGFLVDPAFIYQVGFETWESIKTAARYIRNRNM